MQFLYSMTHDEWLISSAYTPEGQYRSCICDWISVSYHRVSVQNRNTGIEAYYRVALIEGEVSISSVSPTGKHPNLTCCIFRFADRMRAMNGKIVQYDTSLYDDALNYSAMNSIVFICSVIRPCMTMYNTWTYRYMEGLHGTSRHSRFHLDEQCCDLPMGSPASRSYISELDVRRGRLDGTGETGAYGACGLTWPVSVRSLTRIFERQLLKWGYADLITYLINGPQLSR